MRSTSDILHTLVAIALTAPIVVFYAVISHPHRDSSLLERHLPTAELLDRLCPGRGPRCYCSLFEGHAELLDRWQSVCNILVLQSRLLELLDCIWQYSSSLLPRLKVGGGCLGHG